MARYVGFKMGKVHESHTVSDYYCGRCGYPVTDHDSYCPECGGAFRECDVDCLEDEIGNLKTENEKLRRAAERDADVMEALVSYIDDSRVDRLNDENADLRELVRYMHRCYVRGHDWGPFGAPEKAFVEQRMRDLGIEVDK